MFWLSKAIQLGAAPRNADVLEVRGIRFTFNSSASGSLFLDSKIMERAMGSDRELLFDLLDKYSRNNFQCFVAELFQNKDGTQYVICFRPVNVTTNSPDRYNCRYINIQTAQARAAAQLRSLTPAIIEKLDNELPELGRSS